MAQENQKSAFIAMSGGVDSSVAAWLMREQGYRCVGVTMRLYRNADIGLSPFRTCCAQKDMDDASEVAFQLDIPYEILDFTAEFQEQVIDRFIRIYEEGGTPNPCIDCNRFMKFDRLLRYAQAHGFDDVATGHYARIEYDPARGRYLLKKALDASKDQSYVLYMLTQEQLAHTHFPLGGKTKAETRAIAEQLGLCNAHKHDSQDICFVPDGDYAAFMERRTGKTYPADGGRIRLVFDEPQRAVTAGQAVVLYDGEIVVGGGTICECQPLSHRNPQKLELFQAEHID